LPLFVEESVDRNLWKGGFQLPTEWFQAINPLFTILFTPLLAMYWQRSNSKSGALLDSGSLPEPFVHDNDGSKSLNKMATASCLVSVAYTLMFFVATGEGEGQRVNGCWMVIFIATMTMGELHLSPVGLSFISQVSPPHMTSMMMGCWSFAASIGFYIAGFVGSYYREIPHSTFFLILAAVAGFNGITMLFLSHPLQKLLSSTHTVPSDNNASKG